jgi:glycogen operon protein
MEVLDEFKWMVDELHQRGIEVVVDVVYNHTGEGGLWRETLLYDDVVLDPRTQGQLVDFDPKEVAGLYSYRGLDNHAYYALTEDNQFYWNDTDVGNQTRPNHRPGEQLILDSLRFYVEELHVDGFRFDLAPVLGVKDLDYAQWDDPAFTVLQQIIDDPVLRSYNTRIIAEPWAAGGAGYRLGGFPAATEAPGVGWYEWNGKFRDWWRAFLNDDGWTLSSSEGGADGGHVMSGSESLWRWNERRPYHSVNYVTIHDGFTLYDLFSYDAPENNCGPLNPLCCSEPLSPWCDVDSGERNNRSRNWGQDAEPFKRQQMRNAFAAMMFSHGTPMILAGDEWMRTQLGNNNAYSTRADNAYNWLDWGSWQAQDERHRMHDFVRQAIRLRKRLLHAFAPADWGAGAPFRWLSAQATDPPDWNSKRVMIHYYDRAAGPEVLVIVNLDRATGTFTLPAGRTWVRLLDTQSYFDDAPYFAANPDLDARVSANVTLDPPVPVPGASYDAMGSSIVILEAAE